MSEERDVVEEATGRTMAERKMLVTEHLQVAASNCAEALRLERDIGSDRVGDLERALGVLGELENWADWRAKMNEIFRPEPPASIKHGEAYLAAWRGALHWKGGAAAGVGLEQAVAQLRETPQSAHFHALILLWLFAAAQSIGLTPLELLEHARHELEAARLAARRKVVSP